MQITISGRNLEISPAIRDYIQTKAAKLEEFFKSIQKVEVILEARKISDNDRSHVAELRIWLAGNKNIQASEGAKDIYAAFDLALQEAKRQVERHKEKHLDEKRRRGARFKFLSRLKIPGFGPSAPESEL